MAVARRRDAASWAERDRVLAALLERSVADARRVALQVVLPRLKSLINEIRCWDVEERAARVVAAALDVISWGATELAGTPPRSRIYTNTRRRLLRSAVRARSEPILLVDDCTRFEDGNEEANRKPEVQQINELAEWVRERARVRDDVARLVVMTRVASVTVDELADAQDVDPQTLRQRCMRQSLALAL